MFFTYHNIQNKNLSKYSINNLQYGSAFKRWTYFLIHSRILYNINKILSLP